jgi:hypothetical protein
MNDAPIEKVTVQVRGKDVILDPDNMKFSDASLSEYMDKEYGWVDYFGKQLEFANKDCLDAEILYEEAYAKKYCEAKDMGWTETRSKQFALADPVVNQGRKDVAKAKEIAALIKAHLKAWDKNHENAQNRGHTLRKEMEKLHREIYKTPGPLPEDATVAIDEDFFKVKSAEVLPQNGE